MCIYIKHIHTHICMKNEIPTWLSACFSKKAPPEESCCFQWEGSCWVKGSNAQPYSRQSAWKHTTRGTITWVLSFPLLRYFSFWRGRWEGNLLSPWRVGNRMVQWQQKSAPSGNTFITTRYHASQKSRTFGMTPLSSSCCWIRSREKTAEMLWVHSATAQTHPRWFGCTEEIWKWWGFGSMELVLQGSSAPALSVQ